jgi:predicted DsbA family dithiol-disulfide isomerase
MEPVKVTIYTDPGCPFGFNAQRQELQLRWHYGHALDITPTMIVLSERSAGWDEVPFTPEMIAANVQRLRAQYGMPMRTDPPDRMAATIDACRAFVAARIFAPDRAEALLRALRRRAFSDGMALDDPETLRVAAGEAAIEFADLEERMATPQVEAGLRFDMQATRSPLPEALALKHRLSKSGDAYRYSTASAVFESDGHRQVLTGFQPFAVYENAMANVAPFVERRPAPEGVAEILEWAPYPLATAEVAELRGIDREAAREELEAAGARFVPAADDGYWER